MEPANVTTVLDHLVGLTELDVTETNFDRRCWLALYGCNREHLFTLKVLRASNCQIDGILIIEILGSLPNLEVLEAGKLQDTDLQEDTRPWVCKNLRELTLNLVLTSRSTTQPMVLSRLSEMTNLEKLELRGSKQSSEHRLRFMMDQGLDQLRTLRRLKELIVMAPGLGDLWGAEEARWVRKHWPELRQLQGFVMLDQVQKTAWLGKDED